MIDDMTAVCNGNEDDFSRLEINLPNCINNYRYFRSLLKPSTKMLILVKANAYGHGAVEFASMMEEAGADYLAVAYPVEGVELRKAGISMPVLVLTSGTDFFEDIIRYSLEPGIPNMYTLKAFCKPGVQLIAGRRQRAVYQGKQVVSTAKRPREAV